MKRFASHIFLTVLSTVLAVVLHTAAECRADEKTVIVQDVLRGKPVRYAGQLSARTVSVPATYHAKPEEVRAVWIATFKNLDMPCCPTMKDFRKTIHEMFCNLKNAGFNTVVFQIRPSGDAFYPSDHNPLSHYFTGKEGCGFADSAEDADPLEFMIQEAHQLGLGFHAWLNPYRLEASTKLTKEQFLATLSPLNFAKKNPDSVLAIPTSKTNSLMMLDPGDPKVLCHLADTVRELVTKYDMDAIHLDDYFYPYFPVEDADAETFRKYGKDYESVEDWRRHNINQCIYILQTIIRENNRRKNKHIQFGISPFGIWANKTAKEDGAPYLSSGSLSAGSQSFFDQYADSKKWIKDGWIDYIVPQIYWEFAHEQAPYAALTDWWAEQVSGTDVKLYVGHSVYKAGASSGHWNKAEELVKQLKFNSANPAVSGSFFFQARHFLKPENNVQKTAVKRISEGLWGGKLPADPPKGKQKK